MRENRTSGSVRGALGNRRSYRERDIKKKIDNLAPLLEQAPFDIDAAGCRTCGQNSDIQKKLWTMEMEKAVCHNPKCFKRHVNNHLTADFRQSALRKKYKTNGFRFAGDLGWSDYEAFYQKPPAECLKCDDLVTLVNQYGLPDHTGQQRVCIGSKECFKKMSSEASGQKSKDTGSGEPSSKSADEPRVSWHGEYFREKFFKARIPEKFSEMDPGEDPFDTVTLRLSLFALLKSNYDLHAWFARKASVRTDELPAEEDDDGSHYVRLSSEDIFGALRGLGYLQVITLIKEAALRVILQGVFGADGRRLVAEHIGIDLAAEWAMDEEYLDKKTRGEILKFGDELGIFAERKAQDFLFEKLNKKRGKFGTCKKPELVRLMLESGVDLVGRVPAEILGK